MVPRAVPTGDIFGDFKVTDEVIALSKHLAPLVPRQPVVHRPELNKKHAAESNSPTPTLPRAVHQEHGTASQNPGDAIEIPVIAVQREGRL